ncbi:Disease resistance protein RPM1 [Acorus gramineus]|uniref:Disease resistance protein RPM1 n=1 Tax=Acorus gramineus TaxID=55184 RepID=A0AAV9BDH0_ACOGR|nr:Disease resistance protein RPM1 [Acorus gramineus]
MDMVGGLIEKIGSVIAVRAQELADLRQDMEKIKKELEAMQPVIRHAHKVKDTNRSTVNWVREVKEVALNIEDIIDEFSYLVGEHRGGMWGSMKKYIHRSKNIASWFRISEELKGISAQLKDISDRKMRYSDEEMRGRTGDDAEIRQQRAAVTQIDRDDVYYFGMENNKSTLIEWLTNDKETNCREIVVQGMGGLGKTTLVAQVYNSDAVKRNFEFRTWITISQTYKIRGILKNIMKQFFPEEQDGSNTDMTDRAKKKGEGLNNTDIRKRNQKIHDHMKQKSCLIVFDDIWSVSDWDAVRDIFPVSMCTSKIVYTTRSDVVASSLAREEFIFKLKPLKENEAWELFCKRAFPGSCPSELEVLARELVKRCEGLPLAIVVLGGLMFSKKTVSDWKKIHSSVFSLMIANQRVKDILKLSFDDLPYQMKNCFLYCSVFPEDSLIDKDKIIRLWVAEGFIEGNEGRTMEEVATSYLDELISRNLIQDVFLDDINDIKGRRIRIQDLVREIAKAMSKEENFCMLYSGRQAQIENRTRRFLLSEMEEEDNVLQNINEMCHLRALIVFQSAESLLPCTLKELTRSAFRSLRVLDLDGVISIDSLPNAVGNLFNLRFLSLHGTKVRELPESIGSLHNLQTLDLTFSKVDKLPNGIIKLKKLRHLMICDWYSPTKMPGSISDFKDMQTLLGIRAKSHVVQEVGNLTQLRSLGFGELRASDGAKLCASLAKLNNLVNLSIKSDERNDELQLETLTPPQCLSEVQLRGKLAVLPLWLGSLGNLTRLVLTQSLLREDPIPPFQFLPKLAYILLDGAFDGQKMHFQAGGFPSLVTLRIIWLTRLNEITIEEGAMKKLKRLELYDCKYLKQLPIGIEHLTKLKELRMSFMSNEFMERLRPEGEDHWKVKNIPIIRNHWKHIDHCFSRMPW